MTGFLLPRFDNEDARRRLQELADAQNSGTDLAQLVCFSHPKAIASPTGGHVMPTDRLRRVRESVLDELAVAPGQQDGYATAQERRAEYGLSIGVALARNLDVVVADAAHYQGWAFLALCVLPDVVARRWTKMQEDRFIGARRDRNYLKVCWQRWRLLGDMFGDGAAVLGEDQLVQLTERTAVARNRRLVRQLARAVLDYRGPDRMAFTRNLMKRAAYWTGPAIVDLWTDRMIEQHVTELSDELTRTERGSATVAT